MYPFLDGYILSLTGPMESLEVTLEPSLFSNTVSLSVKSSAWSNSQKTKCLVKGRKQQWLLEKTAQPYRVRHSCFFIIYTCDSWWLYCFASIPHFILRKPPLPSWCKERTSHGRCWFRQRWKSVPNTECCSPCAGSQAAGPAVLWELQRSGKGELSLPSPELVKQRPHTSFSIVVAAGVTRGNTDLLD